MTEKECNDLQSTITQAIEGMKAEQGPSFDPEKINLAELGRRTGLSRKRLRRLKKNGFVVLPSASRGTHRKETVLTGYTAIIDDFLRKGISNSEVILNEIREHGYTGQRTQLKEYIHGHKDLIPAPRCLVAPQGNRGRRYHTGPGESYQMDWGFVTIEQGDGRSYRAACFAMICHHCGERFIEFFPNAKQENLFIGMIHGFLRMGVPEYILTDNMKSVTSGRDVNGQPVWNLEYERFMKAAGFRTKLCKPRHPFTKGKVERLIRFVKNNFVAGRCFGNITDLNYEAIRWCDYQNGRYHQSVDCVPHEEHTGRCLPAGHPLGMNDAIGRYLAPLRRISFDGFVNYEGRRFGVPHWYVERTCRVKREEFTLYILSTDLSRVLAMHNVTWSRRDSFCEDQYADEQPEEFPTEPVKAVMQEKPEKADQGFLGSFDFDKEVEL